MYATTKTQAANSHEIANTAFQMVAIAMVGLFSLAQTIAFLAVAI